VPSFAKEAKLGQPFIVKWEREIKAGPAPVKLAVAPQQVQIGSAIIVAGENHLPGVTALSNMMGSISHDHAGETGHGHKISERDSIQGGRA
jgi:hypothetical protein